MLNNIQEGDIYIFPAISRLGRNTGDNISILQQLTKMKCKLIILDLDINTTDKHGKMMFNIMSAISENERDLISTRTQEVMQFMQQNGTLRTKPAFGYQINEENGKRFVAENTREQTIISFIKQLVINKPNIKLAEIMRLMTNNKMALRNGKLYHEGITAILAREGFIKPKFSHTWQYTNANANTNEEMYKNTEKYIVKQ